MSVRRRRWCGALAALALLLCGCGRNAAPTAAGAGGEPSSPPAARQKVVVYSPHGREMLEPFEQRFEAAHPDLDLEWVDMGSQEILDRLRAEKANPYADVWWGAPHTMFRKAAAAGLLAPYRPAWADQVAADQHDPTDLWYGHYLTPSVIVYNSEALAASAAPQDWDDLLQPAWKGKILIRNPLESGTMRTFFAAMILRQKSVEAGYAWLQKLDANTKAYPANPALLHRQLSTREGLVTVWALRDVEIQKRTNHYPLGYVIPKSGCPVVLDAIALVTGGRNPAGAQVLYDFVTDEAQLLWAAEQFDCLPARKDIDHAKLPDRMPQDFRQLQLDWDVVETQGPEWMDHWDRAIRTTK